MICRVSRCLAEHETAGYFGNLPGANLPAGSTVDLKTFLSFLAEVANHTSAVLYRTTHPSDLSEFAASRARMAITWVGNQQLYMCDA